MIKRLKTEEDNNDKYKSKDISERYDMLNIINVSLSPNTKECIESDSDVIGLLGVLFSATMPVNERKAVLEQKYGIPMEEETEGKVEDMCNLSLDIRKAGEAIGEARGRQEGEIIGEARGEARGIQKGETAVIRLLLLRGDSEESIIDLGFTQDDIERARKMEEE